jgi:hypothetical protein
VKFNKIIAALVVLWAFNPNAPSWGQTATGHVYGKVVDQSGAVLPGASVTISGEVGSRSSVTGADGTFRFLNLSPNDYTVTVNLQGFGSANRRITVQTGLSATLDIAMKVGGQSETVEVTAESPLVDVKKRGTSANLTSQDLIDVPNSRDPWGIMNQVAGALVDRVNIAGNENGQQASVAGKGSYAGDRVWSLDGLVITDMAATGASPTYFDFDAFQEINVSTGGGDLTMQSGGFGLNMVTKRGTNTFHGGGRYLVTDSKWQSTNLPDALKTDGRLRGGAGHCQAEGGASAFRENGDNIDSIKDYGFDLGGPIIKDKLWFYGTYGKQDIKNCRFSGTFDDTLLPSYNVKLNWQAAESTMVSAFYFLGSKQKFGRGVGAYPVTESDDFLWNQDNAFTDGGLPGGLWKLEVNHTFSPSFFMSAKGAYYDTGFGLFARGGSDKTYTVDYATSQALGSYVDYQSIRPQTTINVDGNYFASSMGGNHELKFGFGYRESTTNSSSHYNGNQINGEYYGLGTGGGNNIAYATRDVNVQYYGRYMSLYLGDVFTKDRFTFNIGIRVDKQSAKNLASESPGNVSFPTRLPARVYNGSENLIDFTDISPRLGFSYALDEARKTVLRGSFARYGAQLSYGNVTTENPLGTAFIAYDWNDLNGDKFPQPNEVGSTPLFAGGIDPNNPNSTGGSPSKIDTDLKNRYDNEAILGIDRELAANFAVGAALTYRKTSGFQAIPRLSALCPTGTNCSTIPASAYTANATETRTFDGQTYTARTYSPSAALITAGGNGRYRTNRDGYTNTYKGFELTLNKRMSNRWGARVAFSLNDWVENWDGAPVGANGNPQSTDTEPLKNGGPVSVLSGGSGKAAFYSSYVWQIYSNFIVQLPGAFDLSAQIFGRQGGTFPVNLTLPAGSDGTVRALSGNVDDERYENLWNLDFRLARNTKFNKVTLTPSIELFNALNNDVTLSRARNVAGGCAAAAPAGQPADCARRTPPGTFSRIEELISPRILRVGVRLSF